MSAEPQIFREESIEHHARSADAGKVLQIAPHWAPWVFRLLMVFALAGFAYLIFGTVNEYASGPAIARVEGKIELTARADGVVSSVEARPGQRVAAGDLLVSMYSAEETFELTRIEREMELTLVEVLRRPTDPAARQAMAALTARRDKEKARLEERSLVAPAPGIVGDIRVRSGQRVAAGELILSLAEEDASLSAIALVPGEHRPLLEPGAPLRLELSGYRGAHRWVKIKSVGNQVVGLAEARRFLGHDVADMVSSPGPVVLVEADVPRSFEFDGRTLELHDGMHLRADALLRKEPIILALVPALRTLFAGSDGP